MAAQLSRDAVLDRLPIAMCGIIHATAVRRASVTIRCKNL